jgi:uncharacterized protein (DUF1501 family)
MNRRDFVKTSFLTLAASAGMPGFLERTARAAGAKPGKILVVVQLSGGNDGLNTLVPYTNGAYYNARPTLAVSKKDVLPLSGDFGLHPALKPWMKLWDSGELAVVQGVGYPNPNRSHFESMAIWHTADPQAKQTEGWVGKLADEWGDPFCATNFGSTTPLALRSSEVILPSIDSVDRFQLKLEPKLDAAYRDLLAQPVEGYSDKGKTDLLRKNLVQTLQNTVRVQKSVAKYRAGAQYPKGGFAANLRDVARLIAADVGLRIYYVSLGGFDTHAGQPEDHPKLLDNLSSSLVAFRADLEAQGRADDVLVMGFSEFGRRLAENASAGTDHGKASVMFSIGKGVKGGLYGAAPDLEKLDDGDPRFTTDFRSVYSEALDGWLGVQSKSVFGSSFAPLGVLRAAS